METGAKSTEQGNAHPPIRPSTWADLWGEETAPAPARALSSRFPALPLWGSSEEGASLDVASPALLVRLNLSPSLCKAPWKGVLHPLWLPRQVGLDGGAKLCLSPRLRLWLPQGLGPPP